jgi:hypothetical protein
MLGWIFKKKDVAPSVPVSAGPKRQPPPAAAAPKPVVPPPPAVDWAGRLAQAQGDDEALLALAASAGVPLATKQAAVEALATEAALQRAERDFRNHDRRVHQVAKRRLLAAVAERETRDQAARLIEAARQLAGQADAPLNRGAELDRSWQVLDSRLIDPAQRDEFTALSAQLAAQARERTDLERQRKRWQADALQARQALQAACVAAAEGTQDRAALAAAAATATTLFQGQPAGEAAPDKLRADLGQTLEVAMALDAHLADFERRVAGTNPVAEASSEAPAGAPVGDPAPPEPQAQELLLPPLNDRQLAALLQARRARFEQDLDRARQDARQQHREQNRDRQRAHKEGQGAHIAEGIDQAEAALDAGQLADAHRHLSRIDKTLQGAEAPDILRVRLAAVQARLAQLRGWQHWAGGRARDELVAQAEALAAATAADRATESPPEAAADPGTEAPDTSDPVPEGQTADGPGALPAAEEADPHVGPAVPAPARPPKQTVAEVARLSIRQRADVIATLRERWQEIDRLGGAGGRALWLRFDTALKTASEPIAAHAAAQRAARAANLATREELLDKLEAVELPDEDGTLPAPAQAQSLAGALDRFRVDWRKLGPLEHTTPRAAQPALTQRMEAAVGRADAPLQSARHRARAGREDLIARARALAADGFGRERQGIHEVRELQAEWQRQAKSLSLSRSDEQTLWTQFKSAIDASFAAREAAFHARDAEFEAHAAEREALIERLRLNPEDTPQQQRRTLAEVEAAWQRCGPAPRARAQALDNAFRNAHQALRQWLDTAAERQWQAVCEALDAKLALCVAREQGAASPPAEALSAAWQALPVLPPPFEESLKRRAGLAPGVAAKGEPTVDECLLQIEMAWDLPSPPAFEAARRERKLWALKQTLEGRRTGVAETLTPTELLALLLACPALDPAAQDRLASLLAAWRLRGGHKRA